MSNSEPASGWVKPARPRTVSEIKALILERKRDIAALELELFNLQQGLRLEALAQARNIMRAHDLSIDDIAPKRSKRSIEPVSTPPASSDL